MMMELGLDAARRASMMVLFVLACSAVNSGHRPARDELCLLPLFMFAYMTVLAYIASSSRIRAASAVTLVKG